MKLRMGDRIVSAVLGLLAIGSAILYLLVIVPAGGLHWTAPAGWRLWVIHGICALLFLLGLRGVALLFRRRDRGFVMQRTEYGDMSISMKALENMIRRCVEGHEALKLNSIRISRVRDGVNVDLCITLVGGTNIPLTVNALQKQIKQYITSCSGIDVREVRVQVETDLAKLAPPPDSAAQERPAEEESNYAKHLWRHKEEPDTYGAHAAPEEASAMQKEAPDVREEASAAREEPVMPEEAPADEAQTDKGRNTDEALFESETETEGQSQAIVGEEQA